MTGDRGEPGVRIRRAPPAFRHATVRRVAALGPRMRRVTFAGPELAGFTVDQPAASVRVLLPSPGRDDVVVPTWNGNEFLLPDGTRPVIRTFTPRRAAPAAGELDVDVVVHGGGIASAWAARAAPGAAAAVSGPGRGYDIDPAAAAYVLAGDETAIPAISQLLEQLPHAVTVHVHIEIAHPDARLELPAHPAARTRWLVCPDGAAPGDALVPALAEVEIDAATRIWAAGEAAAMQRIRRHCFTERGLPRSQATVRGYWKRGRSGDAAEAG